MRIRLKGLNVVRKRLADGREVAYYYAWKGGPRLRGEPGSPEFVASYNDAVTARRKPPEGVLFSVLAAYQASEDFRRLAPTTRRSYVFHIRRIEQDFGDFPLRALADRRARGEFLAWRDRIASTSGRRQADYAFSVLARVLAWAADRGMTVANPCERAGRLYRGSRVDRIWQDADIKAFLESSPPHLQLALLLALYTGQRQGDLLRLPWSAYDGQYIRLRQSKTGVRVTVPVHKALKAALDAVKKRGPIILTTADGRPWTSDGFRASWRAACARAGVANLTFHDLRGSAVTRLALAGGTESEIAAITGHTLRGVRSILDTHYLHRDPALAEAAIRKLEATEKRTDFSNCSPNQS